VRTTLLDRESALARIATGEVKQVTQLLLDPARVRIWPGNARHQASLTEESCRDLIDSIIAEGGQKVPVVVRRVTDDEAYDYELIAGTRRHWSISWLRANNYPETQLLAQVQNLDNESAFRLADLENRARRDVSDFERARNYREALRSYYGDRQNRMAERLNLSKGWLSKMLTADQAKRRKTSQATIPAADVTRRLHEATQDTDSDPEALFRADSSHGRPAVSVLSANRNGATVRIHAGSGASDAEIVSMVADALKALKSKGRGVTS
jgi:ParB family chromosome partitioning protein